MSDCIFTSEQKDKFKKEIRKKKYREYSSLSFVDALNCAYLDVCRTMTKMERDGVLSNRYAKERCIEIIEAKFKELAHTEEQGFDRWHREACETMIDFYKREKDYSLSCGQAQKWINMALKYAYLYDADDRKDLDRFRAVFHVPVDRYIADGVAHDLAILPPTYDGFHSPDSPALFDSGKLNYAWSRIKCYKTYLKYQEEIREKLKKQNNGRTPLEWEFYRWLEEKEKREKEKQQKN